MRDDHRRISSRCVRNRNSSCTTSLDHTRYKTLPARLARRPTRYKTLPASGLGRPTRYKTLPARPARRPTRYKTLPASPKTPISAHFSHAGRLCTASATNNPSRENFIPHAGPLPVQNSPSKRPWQAHPVQNSPSTPGSAAHPVQNSPSEPQNANFGPLFACRENFVPLPPPTRRAGRKKSRTNTPPHPPTRPSPNFACNSIE